MRALRKVREDDGRIAIAVWVLSSRAEGWITFERWDRTVETADAIGGFVGGRVGGTADAIGGFMGGFAWTLSGCRMAF